MKINYRPEIDGLRAIAVVSVLLYHAQINFYGYQSFKGGYVGVDIFFVISGYLITSIILKELVITQTFAFKNFYEKRIRRILPALLFVILVSLPFLFANLNSINYIDISRSVLYSLGFSSNLYFWHSGTIYGGEIGLNKPFLHTWSLSVEEQFYILFPFIIFITFRYFKKYLIHILILGFITSLIIAVWGSINYPSITFYILPTRAWELLAGSILAYFEITRGSRAINKSLNLILPSIGFVMIGYSIIFFDNRTLNSSIFTLLPVIGACLIIWFSHKNELITKILSYKLFVGIGLISYSLYLWHYPIFVLFDNNFFIIANPLKLILIKIGLFLLVILFSIFTYFYVEKISRIKIKFKVLFLTILLVYILLFISLSIFINNPNQLNSLKLDQNHRFLDVEKYKKEHTNFKSNYEYDGFDERKNIFLVGNSYADDLLDVLSHNKKLNESFYFYTASTLDKVLYPEVIKPYQISCFVDFLKSKSTICGNNNYSSHLIKQYQKSDFIILSQLSNFKFKVINEINGYLKKDDKKFLVLLDDVKGRYINNLNDMDRFVSIYKRIPNDSELDFLEKQFYNDSMRYEESFLIKLKKKLSKNNINYTTRSELFCNHSLNKCELLTPGNEKIYQDKGHLTSEGAKFFSKNAIKLVNQFN
jgi:peptidoglycan/LPS O-acetylase OafA/YrhL